MAQVHFSPELSDEDVHHSEEEHNSNEASSEEETPFPQNPLFTPQRAQLVHFPKGYNSRRRFSVSAESIDPNDPSFQRRSNLPKIEKPPEVRARIESCMNRNILFKLLDQEQIHELIDIMFETRLESGQIIIHQGDDGDNFYIIDRGHVDVLVNNEIIATLVEGRSFGEIALMYNVPRMATVRAKTPAVLWGMDRDTFRRSLMAAAIRKRALYESFLERVPLLESLLPYERSTIADALEPQEFKDGEFIIRQGEPGNAFYIIEKGQVRVTKSEGNSEPIEMLQLGPGGYFGELALLTSQPRAANVIAVGTVKLLTMQSSYFTLLMGPADSILKRNMKNYQSYQEKILELSAH